jgi:membrane-associated phospholipid phosphatase
MKGFFFLLIALVPYCSSGQEVDTLIRKLDSLERRADTTGGVPNNTDPDAYTDRARLNVKTYFTLLGSNFKQQFTAPFHTSKQSWLNVGKFALLTGALAFADEPLQRSALRLRNRSSAVRNVSGFITEFGGLYEGYTLGAIAAYGFIFKKEKMQTTTLLATQAYMTGGAVAMVVKFLSGRQRPNYFGSDTIEAQPTFRGPFGGRRGYNGQTLSSSFPSGHTTVAFAAATVFAMEYRDRPIIPIIAYSAATLVGVSRVTENKHWATDVLVGAALGWLSGRQVVNNFHRYRRLRTPGRKRNTLSFNLQYSGGQLLPGVVYKFR